VIKLHSPIESLNEIGKKSELACKSIVHQIKDLGRSLPKKSQVTSYKNLGRFYRVPFKSLLRV
jgi:hypothetical protein